MRISLHLHSPDTTGATHAEDDLALPSALARDDDEEMTGFPSKRAVVMD